MSGKRLRVRWACSNTPEVSVVSAFLSSHSLGSPSVHCEPPASSSVLIPVHRIAPPCAATSMRDTWMRLRVRRSDFAAQRGPSLCVRNVVFTRHAKAPPHGAWSFELGAYSLETWIRFVAPGGPSHVHAASSERDERSSRHSERPSLRFEARRCASKPFVALRANFRTRRARFRTTCACAG